MSDTPPVGSRSNLIVLSKREDQQINEDQKISQQDLCDCVALHNEIRLMRARLADKRASLRRRLRDGMPVEEGALKTFAAPIARGRFL